MKITLIAVGSRGDIQPVVALAKGLQASGHTVLLASHPEFAPFVCQHGLEFFPLGGVNIREMMQGMTGAAARLGGKASLFREFRRGALMLRDGLRQLHDDCIRSIQGVDLFCISPQLLGMAASIREAGGPPFFCTALQPIDPTVDYPSPFANIRSMGGRLNRLSYYLPGSLLWPTVRGEFNRWRRESLSLTPATLRDTRRWLTRSGPRLYGVSSLVCDKPRDWPMDRYFSGYWELESAEQQGLEKSLLTFLDSGPAPVGIGFGSMMEQQPGQTLDSLIQALQKLSSRCVLLGGWRGWQTQKVPDNIFMVAAADHSTLFPRLRAVVHHGGAGTTAAGLRAGCPSLVIPFAFDQAFWGKRIQDLGCGPAPLPRAKLNGNTLVQALEDLFANDTYRLRAGELARALQDEHGVKRALRWIEQLDLKRIP